MFSFLRIYFPKYNQAVYSTRTPIDPCYRVQSKMWILVSTFSLKGDSQPTPALHTKHAHALKIEHCTPPAQREKKNKEAHLGEKTKNTRSHERSTSPRATRQRGERKLILPRARAQSTILGRTGFFRKPTYTRTSSAHLAAILSPRYPRGGR